MKNTIIERFENESEKIFIVKAPNGNIYNVYGDHKGATQAGPFKTLEEAEKMVKKHRPKAMKMTKILTLKELKTKYENDLTKVKSYEDLKSLASNFVRMITWKKLKDLDYISNAYIDVLPKVIKDILKNGFDEALKTIKKGNLHKAYNINYVYEYYGLDYKASKKALKEQKLNIIE